MSYMKQNIKRKQTLESVQYGLEIICKQRLAFVDPPKSASSDAWRPSQTNIYSVKTNLARPWLLLRERFSIGCCKTKTKPITYQLDYSANLKP